MRLIRIAVTAAFCIPLSLPSHAAAAEFAPYARYPTGSWPNSVAIGDVNSDGRADILMTTGYGDDPANDFKLFVFAQQADGRLGTPTHLATKNRYPGHSSVAIGDLDGDGRLDAAVGTAVGVETFTQSAQGVLEPAGTIPGSPPSTSQLVLADFNLDGRLDVAARTPNGLFVLSRLPDGGYGRSFLTSEFMVELEAEDVNSDGVPDLVGLRGSSLSIFRLTEAGTFTASSMYLFPNHQTSGLGFEAADVTGDGRDDVVVAGGFGLAVYPQSAAGEIAATPSLYSSLAGGNAVEAIDLGRDGRRDVVAERASWERVAVSEQLPSGALGDPQLFFVRLSHIHDQKALALGDVNSDRWPDIALADYAHGLIVLRQIPRNLPPDCSRAEVDPSYLAVAKDEPVVARISGVEEPDGDAVSIRIDGVAQDEPITDRVDHTAPDAWRSPSPGEVLLRAERNPQGDGRVYRIALTASDSAGAECSTVVTTSVQRHKSTDAVDSAPPSYDSFSN